MTIHGDGGHHSRWHVEEDGIYKTVTMIRYLVYLSHSPLAIAMRISITDCGRSHRRRAHLLGYSA